MLRRDSINREDLIGEHPFGDFGQLIFLIVFLVIWILDSFVFHFTTIFTDYIPVYSRLILAGLILIPSGCLAWLSIRVVFVEVRNPPRVIGTGVFSYMRHPMYLAALLFYIGLIFITLSLVSLIFWACIVIFYNNIATYEEKQLENKFGQEYMDYRKKVPKWIPRLRLSKFD